MLGTGEIKYPGGPKLALLHGRLVLLYQGLEEENLDQKSPGPPGWGLMQRASSSLITKKKTRTALKTKLCVFEINFVHCHIFAQSSLCRHPSDKYRINPSHLYRFV